MHASRFLPLLPLLLSSLSLLPASDAHSCGPVGKPEAQKRAEMLAAKRAHDLMVRNHNGFNKRQAASHTDEASAAQITDPVAECTPYVYQPVANIKAQFPVIWQTASIIPGDAVATNLFNSINASVNQNMPNIKVKGLPNGDFTSFTPTYSNTDPDCWWTYHNCVTPKNPVVQPDIYTCEEPSTWGLSYDDGPNCSHNAFYDYLRSNNQKATLFYIGSNVMDWPLEAQRGLQDGHEICVHTWSHQYMTALTNEQVFAEFYYTQKAIHDVIGITPRCWRPPYGDVDDRVRFIAQQLGMTTNIWLDDTHDWQMAPAGPLPTASIDANYAAIFASASAGAFQDTGTVVLSHELTNATMQEAVKEYPQIKSHFQHVVPMGACVNRTHPYLEDVTYPDFAAYIGGSTMPANLPSPTALGSAALTVPIGQATATITNAIGLPSTPSPVSVMFQSAVDTPVSGAGGQTGTAVASGSSGKKNAGAVSSNAGVVAAVLGAGAIAGALLV